MNKRIMRAVAILPLALLVIATGCFGAKPVDKPEASTTLTLYSTDPGGPEVQEVLDRAKAAFEQAHRGVTVHYAFTTLDRYFTDLDKLVQSAEPPDLIIMGQAEFAPFEEKGYLQDLQPLAKANGDTLSNYYDEAIVKLGVVKNRLVALMINVSPVVVAYNTKVFAQANLPVPKDSWTWDDFANTAKRLRDTVGAGRNNFQAAAFPPGERLLAPLVLGRGGSYTSPDGTTVKGYLDGKDSVLVYEDAGAREKRHYSRHAEADA
ncbi:ABC transporter substrate-binding protein [Paenibacillus cymbidii]|uniref:ABC transporter substrate-binding protein n=1 Tax=Paenibacillus cymbidii TaxID=1639034 RepID=UPI0010808985|nr:extracellular solute-binding protein [Paenibacillus cymbidii]